MKQIYANWKGKVALEDIALWANRCTKCLGNAISRFYLIVEGEFFTGNYILWHSPHSSIIFECRHQPPIVHFCSTFLRLRHYVHFCTTLFKQEGEFSHSKTLGTFGHIFCSSIHSTVMKGCHKFEMMTLCPWPFTFWTQNQSALTDCRGLLLCQVSSHSDQGFSFYHAIYTRAHRNKVIAISVPPYYIVGVDSNNSNNNASNAI